MSFATLGTLGTLSALGAVDAFDREMGFFATVSGIKSEVDVVEKV